METIVSLAPSATATLQSLGVTDCIIGVTDHDTVAGADSLGGWLTPDIDRLDTLNPDLVITVDSLQTEIRDRIRDKGYSVLHTEPTTLEDVLASFSDIATAIGEEAAGEQLERTARRRLEAIREYPSSSAASSPLVYCEEWPSPPMAAGNWIPELIELVGGSYPWVEAGARSQRIDPAEITHRDPDYTIIHHCGMGSTPEMEPREAPWDTTGSVHVVDDSLLNQPSPRLLEGAERLAHILHGSEAPLQPLKGSRS